MRKMLFIIAIVIPTLVRSQVITWGDTRNTNKSINVLKDGGVDSIGNTITKIFLPNNPITWTTGSAYLSKLQNGQTQYITVYEDKTTVLNKGQENCTHNWAEKQEMKSNYICLVWHNGNPCPDSLPNIFRICTKCLRHENIVTTYHMEAVVDEYTKALNKLNKQ